MVCFEKPVDVHHMKTTKSGGSDNLDNLMPLCRKHHVEFHTMGIRTWWGKYGDGLQEIRMSWGLPSIKNYKLDLN